MRQSLSTGLLGSALGLALFVPTLHAAADPASIASPSSQAAESSFDSFAREWMGKLRTAEQRNRARPQAGAGGVSYRGFGMEFDTELRATGHPTAPYVGILRYQERLYSCTDAEAASCSISAVTPVTEIFRYQDGRWVY